MKITDEHLEKIGLNALRLLSRFNLYERFSGSWNRGMPQVDFLSLLEKYSNSPSYMYRKFRNEGLLFEESECLFPTGKLSVYLDLHTKLSFEFKNLLKESMALSFATLRFICSEGPLRAEELERKFKLNRVYCSKILKDLKKANLIESRSPTSLFSFIRHNPKFLNLYFEPDERMRYYYVTPQGKKLSEFLVDSFARGELLRTPPPTPIDTPTYLRLREKVPMDIKWKKIDNYISSNYLNESKKVLSTIDITRLRDETLKIGAFVWHPMLLTVLSSSKNTIPFIGNEQLSKKLFPVKNYGDDTREDIAEDVLKGNLAFATISPERLVETLKNMPSFLKRTKVIDIFYYPRAFVLITTTNAQPGIVINPHSPAEKKLLKYMKANKLNKIEVEKEEEKILMLEKHEVSSAIIPQPLEIKLRCSPNVNICDSQYFPAISFLVAATDVINDNKNNVLLFRTASHLTTIELMKNPRRYVDYTLNYISDIQSFLENPIKSIAR